VRTAACAWRRFRGRGGAVASRATSRTSSRSWRSRWPRSDRADDAIAWDTVGRIVDRVVAERLDPRRLDGLRMVGVDEVSYRRRHRYLTVVADHDTGRIVWLAKGRNSATLQRFFDELGGRRSARSRST
jgi:transposase